MVIVVIAEARVAELVVADPAVGPEAVGVVDVVRVVKVVPGVTSRRTLQLAAVRKAVAFVSGSSSSSRCAA